MRTLAKRLVRLAIILLGFALSVGSFRGDGAAWITASAADPCLSPANAIVAENCQSGTPEDVMSDPTAGWGVSGPGDANIQGFATDMSVNRGAGVDFKI